MPSKKSSTSAGKRKESRVEADPYHGYKDISLLSEFVIRNLFPSNDNSSSSIDHLDATSSQSTSSSYHKGNNDSNDSWPRLAEFVAYALYRTQLPNSILFTALFLLWRLKSMYPHVQGTSSSPHRLFLSSLMLAAKITQDDTFSNKSWTIVANGGGMDWDLKEINQLERELFGFLKWTVVVRDEELEEWEEMCRTAWAEEQGMICRDEKPTEMPQGDDMDWDILKKEIDSRVNGVNGDSQPPIKSFGKSSPPESPTFDEDLSYSESSSPLSPRSPLTPASNLQTCDVKRLLSAIDEKSFRPRSSPSISTRIVC